jgi:hypothetical protein
VTQGNGPPGIADFDNLFAGPKDPVTWTGIHLAGVMGLGGSVDIAYYKHGADRGIAVSPGALAGIESSVSFVAGEVQGWSNFTGPLVSYSVSLPMVSAAGYANDRGQVVGGAAGSSAGWGVSAGVVYTMTMSFTDYGHYLARAYGSCHCMPSITW